MNQFSHILKDQIDAVCKKLYEMGRDDLALLFTKCYPNTLETTTKLLEVKHTLTISSIYCLLCARH